MHRRCRVSSMNFQKKPCFEIMVKEVTERTISLKSPVECTGSTAEVLEESRTLKLPSPWSLQGPTGGNSSLVFSPGKRCPEIAFELQMRMHVFTSNL